MHRWIPIWMLGWLSLCCLASAAVPAADPARYAKVLDRWVAAYNAGDYAGAGRDYSLIMRLALPKAESQAFFQNMAGQYGKLVKYEPFVPASADNLLGDGAMRARATFERGRLDITMTLNNQNQITGIYFLPPRADRPVPERNQTRLRLPFDAAQGSWLTVWGGPPVALNQHHDDPAQWFAFDWIGAGPDGQSHRGDGTRNDDYLCWGRTIHAPAAGEVLEVIDGVRDNTPGTMNPYSALGNAVTLKHAENEYSVLAHLQCGSVRVKAGDQVTTGQVLGLCGNSGNSSEPHLHFHLQNAPDMPEAVGFQAFFIDVTKRQGTDWIPVQGDLALVKGDIIAPIAVK